MYYENGGHVESTQNICATLLLKKKQANWWLSQQINVFKKLQKFEVEKT